MPCGRTASAGDDGGVGSDCVGGLHRKPSSAGHDFRQRGGRGDAKRHDLFLDFRIVLSVSGGLQFLRGPVPLHGEFQGVHVHLPGDEWLEYRRKRYLYLRSPHGRGRGCHPHFSLQSLCGCADDVSDSETGQRDSDSQCEGAAV